MDAASRLRPLRRLVVEVKMTGGTDNRDATTGESGTGIVGPNAEIPPLPPAREELPTLPDGITGAMGQLASPHSVVALSAGTFGIPTGAAESEPGGLGARVGGAPTGPESLLDAVSELEPPTLRLDSDSVWRDLVTGPPTPRRTSRDEGVGARAVEPEEPNGGGDATGDAGATGEALALGRLAPPPVPAELGPGGLEPEVAPAQLPPVTELADAVDDDETDPAVPSARRRSERAPRPSTPPTKESSPPPARDAVPTVPPESCGPPAVSVSLRPPEDRTAPGTVTAESVARRPARGGSRGWWVAATLCVAGGLALGISRIPTEGASSSNELSDPSVEGPAGTVASPGAASAGPIAAAPGVASAGPIAAAPGDAVSTRSTVSDAATGTGSRVALAARAPRSDVAAALQPRVAAASRVGPTEASDPTPSQPAPGVGAVAESGAERAPFDRAVAASALDAAASHAAGCRRPGDPSGIARVTVTFAAGSGRVTQATVSGPPFAGTVTGGCIARTLRQATVPPFAGTPVTVQKVVVIQ